MMTLRSWRVLPPTVHSGARNMGIDAMLLEEVEAGTSPPTLRIYGWKPRCISLGYHQKSEKELDIAALERDGVHAVYRSTGGRAVLHDGELTYSLIAPIEKSDWSSTLAGTYDLVSRALRSALQSCGVDCDLEKGKANPYICGKARATLPCFSSTARSEVENKGRKLVGSAQRRLKKSFLQHGSILLNESHTRIVEYLCLSENEKKIYLDSLKKNSVSISQITDHLPSPKEFSEAMAGSLEVETGVRIEPKDLELEEMERAKKMVEEVGLKR